MSLLQLFALYQKGKLTQEDLNKYTESIQN